MRKTLVIIVLLFLGKNQKIIAQSNQCLTIDFETIENGIPSDGAKIFDQYLNKYGVTFQLENGSPPVLAKVGFPTTAFQGPTGGDSPAPNQNIGQFFITDDGFTSNLTAIPLIVRFKDPVDSVSAVILDMDFDEIFTVDARDINDVPIFTKVIRAGEPNTGDGIATPFGFNLDGCVGAIYSLRFEGKRQQQGGFGFAMDNFSFCFSGIDIETKVAIETEPINCKSNLGKLIITNNGKTAYQYSIDGVNFWPLNASLDLPKGIYDVIIKDDNNCRADFFINLDYPDPILISKFEKFNTTCNKNNGIIDIEANGIGIKYKFSRNDIDSIPPYSDLPSGHYTVEVVDDYLCSQTLTFEIEPSESIQLNNIITTKDQCKKNNGTVHLILKSRNPVSLNINDIPVSSLYIENLEKGKYQLSLKDSFGCILDTFFNIDSTVDIIWNEIQKTPTDCQAENGSFTYNVSGGEGKLDITFDGNHYQSLSNTINNLNTGIFELLVQDSIGCEIRESISIGRNKCPIWIPNIIHSNANHTNNLFSLHTIEDYLATINRYTIYDRWGSKIFDSRNFSIHENSYWWNGYFNGKLCETDVYVYVVEILHPNGELDVLTGDVTLLK